MKSRRVGRLFETPRGLIGGSRRLDPPYTPDRLFPFRFIVSRTRVHSAPIRGIHALIDVSMERRERIISRKPYQSVLYRVPVDVINAPIQIILISARMFPKTSLPNSPFAMQLPGLRGRSFGAP